jgi:hypothetical protein
VRSDNTRAIAFYKKDGWNVECMKSKSVYFHRYIAEVPFSSPNWQGKSVEIVDSRYSGRVTTGSRTKRLKR